MRTPTPMKGHKIVFRILSFNAHKNELTVRSIRSSHSFSSHDWRRVNSPALPSPPFSVHCKKSVTHFLKERLVV